MKGCIMKGVWWKVVGQKVEVQVAGRKVVGQEVVGLLHERYTEDQQKKPADMLNTKNIVRNSVTKVTKEI